MNTASIYSSANVLTIKLNLSAEFKVRYSHPLKMWGGCLAVLAFLFTSHVYQKVFVRAVCTQTTAWMSLTPTMCHVVPSSLTSRTTSWRWKASRPSSLTARPRPTPRPPTACTKYWSTTPSPSPPTWIQGAPPSILVPYFLSLSHSIYFFVSTPVLLSSSVS